MEIGSEFWIEDKDEKGLKEYEIEENKNSILFMSGRTAIDYALEIITKEKKIENVYFPSYCCQSMLDPFISRNIEVYFYNVSFNEEGFVYDIDCNKKCDLFFAMNYFGYSCNNMDYYIDNFKNKNSIVIEDCTHSWLSKRKYNTKSDFVVASLRKWFPIISGGILINCSKEFKLNKNINLKENDKYTNLKKKAMIEKGKYIKRTDKIEKKDFLQKFHKTEEILDCDYKEYKIDNISYNILSNINFEEIINKRKNNIKEIYKFLEKQKKIKYIKNIDMEDDCLLFVPIFLPQKDRNKLKDYLIKNDVYCPNHWPIPNMIFEEKNKEIYNMELSLICDQRYEAEKIKNYISIINNIVY